MPGSGCFDRGTNGLASGNSLGEAVLHGLCEVIERDALALWEVTNERTRVERRIDLTAVADPVVAALHSLLAGAGVRAVTWDVTSDIVVPTYEALIFEEDSDPLLNPRGAAFGAGCHPDPTVALARAITEAAQSRLTAIAGSRDDLRAADYGAEQAIWASKLLDRLDDEPHTCRDVAMPGSLATASCEEDVGVIAQLLQGRGIDQVIIVDLSPRDTGVNVVRVIVPGLEGTTQSTMYRPGARARVHAKQNRDQG
jgi:ribosomal protein S12 methylthiotransferase accessory factor